MVWVKQLNFTHITYGKYFLITNIENFIQDIVYDCLNRILYAFAQQWDSIHF